MCSDRVISRRTSDYASLPEILCSTEEGESDISNRIDMEIQKEATELATSPERDARRNTLKYVPFDPFLKLLQHNVSIWRDTKVQETCTYRTRLEMPCASNGFFPEHVAF